MFIGVQSRIIFNYFLDNCLIKVGDGRRIKFWHDKWCGATSLKNKFLTLFTLSSAKSGSLHFFYAMKSSSNGWNLLYRRPLYAWELADEARLFDLIVWLGLLQLLVLVCSLCPPYTPLVHLFLGLH
ncbi:unnamed protein product [Camellia sinensis]